MAQYMITRKQLVEADSQEEALRIITDPANAELDIVVKSSELYVKEVTNQ